MSDLGDHHSLERAASASSQGGSAESASDDPPELTGRLPLGAAWLAIAAAPVTCLAVMLAASTLVDSRDWRAHEGVEWRYELAASNGTVWIIGGVLLGIALGIVVFAMGSRLLGRPRRAVAVLTAIGLPLVGVAAMLLFAPDAFLGGADDAEARAASPGLSDATLAGLGLLLAAALMLGSAALAALAMRRAAAPDLVFPPR